MALLSTWLNLEPSYLAQLFINTGANHKEEIVHLLIIFLKLWIFFLIFCSFSSFGIHTKDTKFINETHHTHTHTNIDTHRHRQTDTDVIFTFYTFWLIWHICQRYKFYIWHTTDLHMHRHSDMHTHRHTDVQRHWHTDTDTKRQACLYTYTHAYTLMCMWEIYGNC